MNNSNKSHIGLAVLRIAASALLLTHGYGKLQMLLAGGDIEFMSVLGLGPTISLILAVLGEFVAALLVLIGFKTRFFAIFPAIIMAVAFFVIHSSDPLGKKELPLLYLIVFVSLILLGGGKYSLDGFMGKKS
ncbi:DoxX family protein [Galbibacter sp. EGI 63066]|uniref:DoxX family protein n=1 Tax=Galbibacter sp. EGI 63066 TaxID=2993559 RepID=UPI002248D11B|nr:DoxX family protein [Galbibacter sp. EGI 63066]MCX2680184.1 DoxX family protein [Galbibacter sp. EGI 63066]